MIEQLLVILGLAGVLIGSYIDLKTREVPDMLNFFLVSAAIGLRLIYAMIYNQWTYLLYGIYGLGAAILLGYFMYYTGQWGGGDSKMVFALGALFATYPDFLLSWFSPILNIPFLIIFLLNVMVAGAAYGLMFSAYLAWKNKKEFGKAFRRQLEHFYIMRIGLFIIAVIAIIAFFALGDPMGKALTAGMLVSIVILSYILFFLKAVEQSCMYKNIPPEHLTLGDWIAEEVYDKKKYVTGPKDLGVEQHQIDHLIRMKKANQLETVRIKEGIPFVPSFLLGLIISLVWGNWLFPLIMVAA